MHALALIACFALHSLSDLNEIPWDPHISTKVVIRHPQGYWVPLIEVGCSGIAERDIVLLWLQAVFKTALLRSAFCWQPMQIVIRVILNRWQSLQDH